VAETITQVQHAIAVAILNANALADDTTIYEALTFPQVARFANVRGYLADARDAAALVKKETEDLKAERDRALAEVGRLEDLARTYIDQVNRYMDAVIETDFEAAGALAELITRTELKLDAALQSRGEGEA
jgi:hypothetical protein